jgi:nitrate/nitrite transporter NarK
MSKPGPKVEQDNQPEDWHAMPPRAAATTRVRWTKLFTDRQMLLLCFQQFLRAGAMVFFYTWFARYLQETKGLSEQDAAEFSSWPPFAGIFGGLLGGLVSDYILRRTGNSRLARQGMTLVGLVICTCLTAIAYFVNDTRIAVLLISMGAFFGMASGVSAYAMAISYGGKRVALVFATMNMCGNLGATLFPAVVGWMGDRGYWSMVLVLFTALFGLAACCWAMLNPRGTLFDDEEPKEEQ